MGCTNLAKWHLINVQLHMCSVYCNVLNIDIIQLMTFHKVDTVIYQPRGSDVHRRQRLG